MPRVVLVPGLGLFGVGNTSKDAKIAADLAETTVEVVADAERLGTYECIPEPDIFDIEYWSLEQAKLGAAAEKPLARRIAVVTGGASGIGAATAAAFAKEGAEVVGARPRRLQGQGHRPSPATSPTPAEVRAAFDKVAATYGGVDIVVSNAGAAWQGQHRRRVDEVPARELRAQLLGASERGAERGAHHARPGTGRLPAVQHVQAGGEPGTRLRSLRPAQGGDALPDAASTRSTMAATASAPTPSTPTASARAC